MAKCYITRRVWCWEFAVGVCVYSLVIEQFEHDDVMRIRHRPHRVPVFTVYSCAAAIASYRFLPINRPLRRRRYFECQ